MGVDDCPGKGMSDMGKFGSVIDRMNMKLGSKFLNSLGIKTQLLKRLQRCCKCCCKRCCNGATHSQKDGVEGTGGSLKDSAEAFVLFLCGAQLVLRLVSSQYLILMR
jgi:hypothetical protein